MTVVDSNRSVRGFTLVEILVVIGLLGLLVVAFAPSISGALSGGDRTETEARMASLAQMAEAYARYYGDYPPDDFSLISQDRQGSWDFGPDNGKNSGIESLVMHLMWEPHGGGKLDGHEDWLVNTDRDRAAVTIPLLERRDKVEVVDAWGTPLAYFSARVGSGYTAAQVVVAPGYEDETGIELQVRPWQNPNSEGYLNPRKFQIVSAGEDLEFNTDDDLTWPQRPRG